MKTKFSRFLKVAIGVLFSVILTCALFSVTTYAESSSCSGRMLGTTAVGNSNAGKIYFNSHPAPSGSVGAYDQDGANLSIAGLTGNGFAPANADYAACVSETTASTVAKNLKKYRLEGYAWNDNLGFVSFYCDKTTKKNPATGVPCGDHDYGVLISDDVDGDGVRQLSGYGWNESFGYINFSCHNDGVHGFVDGLGQACGSIDYGVTMSSSGNLSGYAWSEAQIWIPFKWASVRLPDKDLVQQGGLIEGTSGNVVGNWCNSGVKPNVCVEVAPDPMYMVGTNFDTETRVADGEDGYNVHVFLKKADGVTPISIGETTGFSLKFTWKDTVKTRQLANSPSSSPDAVVNPLDPLKGGVTITNSNFSTYFTQFESETGHYVLKDQYKIVSFAPTTNANISYTTSTKPAVPVENGTFIVPLTDQTVAIERNDLILERIDFEMNGSSGVIYPEGKAGGVSFKFRPAIEVNTLYANDLQDTINAFRNIPVNFVAKARKVGGPDIKNLTVDLNLDYSKAETRAQDECDAVSNDFNFKFLPAVPSNTYTLGEEDLGAEQNLIAVASLDDTAACDTVKGASLYSTVKYKLAQGDKWVEYYSNKLPRITTSIANPSAVIHGNIYATKAFSPTVSNKTQTTGSISVDSVRNSIYENIKKLIPPGKIKNNQNCTITGLSTNLNGGVVTGCDAPVYTAQGENILYFTNSEIHMNLSMLVDKWLVIVEGGNLYIDGDIYNSDPADTARFSAVVLKPNAETCKRNNIYVDADVRDVYANVVSDCSVFSYDSSLGNGAINSDTGLPSWANFGTRINSLGKQLYWKGSIASRNTIGGADLDADGSKYLLLGTGEALPTDTLSFEGRLKAQMYDLNYLRLFKADVEISETGLPIDQSCGKALSIPEMVAIAEWKADPSSNPAVTNGGKTCDGIDPTKMYNPAKNLYGDLVPPKDTEHLSRSLEDDQAYDPVYVFYRAPESFIFTKGGKVKK